MIDVFEMQKIFNEVQNLIPLSGKIPRTQRKNLEVVVKILREFMAYREIGTVEECRKAVEKQKPKPCEFYGDEEDGKLVCPNCGEDLWDLKECGFDNYPYCGQAVML